MKRSIIGMLLLFFGAGCAMHFAPVDTSLQDASQTFHVPPKKLLEIVKQVVSSPPLSLPILETKEGSILTGFEQFPGDWHIARRWQERTQFRITVHPDWNDPTGMGTISIRELTEQRASDGMKWEPSADLHRPERAKDLLKKIDAQIQKQSSSDH